MSKSFKQWLDLQELSMGSDGMRDNTTTQTAQATAKVAQKWLGNDQNSDQQAALVTGTRNRSTLANKLFDAGAKAVDGASSSVAKQTTAPAVAGFLQNQLKLPGVVPQPIPGNASFMRKRMKKQ